MAATPGYALAVAFPRLFGRSDPAENPVFRRARPDERGAAVGLVFGAPPHAAASLERRAAREGLDLTRTWIAEMGGTLEGAAMLVPHPGRTALLLTSPPRDLGHAERVGRLAGAMLADAEAIAGLDLVQSLCAPEESLRAEAFRIGGLRHLATLDYLERADHPSLPAPRPREGVTFERWNPAERRTLERLLVATYVDTLDCPGLAQVRRIEDIVDGHLSACGGDARHWFIGFAHGAPIAAALVSVSLTPGTADLVYLGVVPEWRGKGVGAMVMLHALRSAALTGAQAMSLAVDTRNAPAIRLYRGLGFARVRTREAFVASTRR